MEVLLIGAVVIVGLAYWIWADSKKTNKSLDPETMVAPTLTKTVTTPSSKVADGQRVVSESVTAPKQTKKPAAKAKKPAAIKAPAKKPVTKKPKTK